MYRHESWLEYVCMYVCLFNISQKANALSLPVITYLNNPILQNT